MKPQKDRIPGFTGASASVGETLRATNAYSHFTIFRFSAFFILSLLFLLLFLRTGISQAQTSANESRKSGSAWELNAQNAVSDKEQAKSIAAKANSETWVENAVEEIEKTQSDYDLAEQGDAVKPVDVVQEADLIAQGPLQSPVESAEPQVSPVEVVAQNPEQPYRDAEKVAVSSSLRVVPQVDISTETLENLELQFRAIQKLEETEDSFSPNLGEAYLGYGQSLANLGRLDEARDMYAKALHLAKINNGVYAIEQRPSLQAMYEMHYAKGEVENAESVLKQIIWLEKKHPDKRDAFSFDMVVRLGNLYLDQYYQNPKITEENVARVDRGIRYLNYAINRYGGSPLSERLMPYGELTLLYTIKNSMSRELDRAFYDQARHRTFADLEKAPSVHPRRDYLSRAISTLQAYYEKASREGRVDHQVRALRDLGDLYLMFNRGREAAETYNSAWVLAANLDEGHALVQDFDEPAILPDFNYAGDRARVSSFKRSIRIPMSFNLDKYGRVSKVLTEADEVRYPKLVPRAKRASRRLVFRPTIENGRMISTDEYSYDVLVRLRLDEELEDQGES